MTLAVMWENFTAFTKWNVCWSAINYSGLFLNGKKSYRPNRPMAAQKHVYMSANVTSFVSRHFNPWTDSIHVIFEDMFINPVFKTYQTYTKPSKYCILFWSGIRDKYIFKMINASLTDTKSYYIPFLKVYTENLQWQNS